MKRFLATIFTLLMCGIGCSGQKSFDNKTDIQQAIIKKRVAVSNLELQIRDVPYAAVRNYVRNKTIVWLWQNGKDETGQAEELAVKAFEEINERKNEIPEIYFLSLKTEILAMLQANSPITAKKLTKKYNISDEENLDSAYANLDGKDGEKRASEALKKSLVDKNELSPAVIELISELNIRKSPELAVVLSEIIGLEESERSNFSTDSLLFIVDAFRSSIISNDLRTRFYSIVLKKAGEAVASNESDSDSTYGLLYAISEDIFRNAPNLMSEANVLAANLKGRVNASINEDNEVYEKIQNSSDRLNAMISAAETTEDKSRKKDLYGNASLLALKKKKFVLAVELLEKSQVDENLDDEKNKFSLKWHDQFLDDVVEQSLIAGDIDSGKYASGKIIDKLVRAEVLRKSATYFFEKQNLILATSVLDEALAVAGKADNNALKVRILLRLIPTFQKIDRMQITDVVEKAAKAINSLPTLNTDDKPETENYLKYVTSMMIVDINLLSTMNYLVKENKNGAADLADRINRREVKIIADYAVLTDSMR